MCSGNMHYNRTAVGLPFNIIGEWAILCGDNIPRNVQITTGRSYARSEAQRDDDRSVERLGTRIAQWSQWSQLNGLNGLNGRVKVNRHS